MAMNAGQEPRGRGTAHRIDDRGGGCFTKQLEWLSFRSFL